jgi:carboxypeptidase C (cathepsin A)
VQSLKRSKTITKLTDQTRYFLTQNALIRNDSLPFAEEIDLQSVMIGNGWYDPRIQYEAFYWFAVSPGNTYDYKPFNSSVEAMMYNSFYGPGNCQEQSLDCNIRGNNDVCAVADTFCYNNVESLLGTYAQRSEYDIRELVPDPFPYGYWREYLNSAKIQQALGAFVNYTGDGGSTVGSAFANTGDDDRESGTVAASRFLADEGVYTVHFAGDADYVCNWLGVEAIVADIDAPGFHSAGFVNISTSDSLVHGQVKQSDNVAFVRIYESGHEVPFYQPLVALEMFERVINGQDVATGKQRVEKGCGYKTVGPMKSTFREGNATVQFENVPEDAIYNTTTHEPNPLPGNGTANAKRGLSEMSSKMLSRRANQPIAVAGPVKMPRW